MPSARAATAGTADVSAYLFGNASTVANDATSLYTADVFNEGNDNGGGAAATGVTIVLTVAGATLVSAAEDPGDGPQTVRCTEAGSTATCALTGTLELGGGRAIDVEVTGGSNGGTESVTEIVSETPADADPDHDNDSTEVDAAVVTPPAGTLTVDRATPDTDEDGVTLQATLTSAGSAVSGAEIDVYAKQQGAADSSYIRLSTTGYTGDDGVDPGTAHLDIGSYLTVDYDDAGPMLQGPVTFKLVHPADPNADTASATVNVTPRPVTATIVVPRVTTYSADDDVTISGHVARTGGQSTPLAGSAVLASRPAGSSVAWRTSSSPDLGDGNAARFSVVAVHDTEYRISYISDGPGSASTTSPIGTLAVRQRVRLVASPSVVPPGGFSSLSVTVGPVDRGGKLTLQKRTGGSWKAVAHGALSASSTRSWSYTYRVVGSASYRVVSAGSALNSGTTTSVHTVTVAHHGSGSANEHTFLYQDGSGHARWNPCAPIHYAVNTSEAPAGALATVQEVLRRISQISKLRFVYDGKTTVIPSLGRPQREPAVIAWAHQNQTNFDVSGGTIGEGGGRFEEYGTLKPVVISGYAVLQAGYKLTPGFGSGETEGELLMHELGHMVGLDHVTETSQIMYPVIQDRANAMYGAGDYRGLQLLGRSQGCLKTPPKSSAMLATSRAASRLRVVDEVAP